MIGRRDRRTSACAGRLAPGLALLLGLAVVVLLGCGDEATRPSAPVRSIKWTPLVAPDALAKRRLSGVVRPVDQSQLSFEVGGRIETLEVALGDRARAGDLLATLDRQPFELAVHRAEAELKEAEAFRWRDRAEFERQESLYAAAAVSRAELDQARAARESAESRLRAARAELGLAKRDLRNASLRAPFDGVISAKHVDRFVEVAAGLPVFELDSEDRFEILVGVPDRLIAGIQPGDRVQVHFSAVESPSAVGVVHRVGTRSREASTFPVKVRVEGQVEGLRAGMSAEVVFAFRDALEGGVDEASSKVFRVPLAAVASAEADGHVVFLFDRERSAVDRTPVELLEVYADEVEIAGEALAPGAVIATAGVEFLSDGQTVKLLENDAS